MNKFIEKSIINELKKQGATELNASVCAKKGVERFNQCNMKDPYFECLVIAGKDCELMQKGFKFKKPAKVGGTAFKYTKPQPRKHKKGLDSLF